MIVIFTLVGGIFVSFFTIYTFLSPPKNAKRSWVALGACLIVIALISFGFAALAYGLAMGELEDAIKFAKAGSADAMRARGTEFAMAPVKIAMGNIFALVVAAVAIFRGAKS